MQYYVYDGHGNVTGYAGENYSYDAFGNLQTDNENINPFLYCGEYTDAETGMIYLRNRYYDPTTGRFITKDIAMTVLAYIHIAKVTRLIEKTAIWRFFNV